MSKFELISLWPAPTTVRDIARLVGFGQFYSSFIPNFEIMIGPLHEVMKANYPTPITPAIWTPAAEASWQSIKSAILSDPCLMRYDHRKLTILRTDFSSAVSDTLCASPIMMLIRSRPCIAACLAMDLVIS